MTIQEPLPEKNIVWIVEDNAELRSALVEILSLTSDLTCPVDESSMEQIFHTLEAGEKPLPSVILIDLGLPGLSGLEGIRRLKQWLPECELLVLTVYEDNEKIYEAISNGATGYLLKTEQMKKIPEAIRDVCRGGSPMSPPVARMVLGQIRSSSQPENDYGLSPREIEVLTQMTKGFVKKEIAESLELSFHTVNFYVREIYKKLQVNTVQGAVGKALEERLLKEPKR